MKQNTFKKERGQALVLIAIAAVGLFAFAALAIDGGMVFSDRRHAQNAADTSVLAAALARVRGQAYTTAALNRALSNGYNNNGTTNVVEVYLCNDANATCAGLPAGADLTEYVQVKITSHVNTFFTRIIGRSEVTNRVDAVARAVPGNNTNLFSGNAMVALNKTSCSAFEFKGSSGTIVQGSGIFVNSSCDWQSQSSGGAFSANTGSGTFSTPCVNVVGDIELGTNTTLIAPGTTCSNSEGNLSNQMQNPSGSYPIPNITCADEGTYTSTTLSPGNYHGAFPPGNQTLMNPGIYCIDAGNQGFSLQGGQTLSGTDVLIYMKTGDVKWTSGGINLSAIYGTDTNGDPFYYNGLLLVMAPNNTNSISISGNGTSSFTGTILAPNSNVSLSGGSSTGSVLNNQIIADTITLTGSNTLTISFDASQQWTPPIPPAVEIIQ